METSSSWVIIFSFAILATICILGLILWFTWRSFTSGFAISPYTGAPLRKAKDIPYFTKEKINLYLRSYKQYDNSPFSFDRATFCRDTNRIFPDSISFLGIAKVDWSFLMKRYPGNYLSWGSLQSDQQTFIRESHESLAGFQTDNSCPNQLPREITPEYVYTRPGPLYVDLSSKVLLGWKLVPETNIEVLVVQKPIK